VLYPIFFLFLLDQFFWCEQRQAATARNKEQKQESPKTKSVRRPGIEPGSTAWKATMLTITPATLSMQFLRGK
jgi:hypothetical protein